MRGQNSVLRMLAMLVPLLMPPIFVSEAYPAWGVWELPVDYHQLPGEWRLFECARLPAAVGFLVASFGFAWSRRR